METQVMVPGILVALKSRVSGGVEYRRKDLEGATRRAKEKIARWETTRLIEDVDAYERALKARGDAQTMIRRLCVATSFGLLCPQDREGELDAAIAGARAIAAEFNASQSRIMLHVTALKGRIADNDADAIRAIVDEATDLIEQMGKGMDASDVKAIRDAAMRAKRLTEMMGSEMSDQVITAVELARDVARRVVKETKEQGATALLAIEEGERKAFDAARFAFLDIAQEQVESLPSVDLQRVASIEIRETAPKKRTRKGA